MAIFPVGREKAVAASAAAAGEGEPAASERLTLHRILSAAAAVSLLWGAVSCYGGSLHEPAVGLISAIVFTGAMILLVVVCVARSSVSLSRIDLILLVLGIALLFVWTWSTVLDNTNYETDEEIFVQYAAQLFGHGHNPYGVDMTPAFNAFPLPAQQFTPKLNGTYPADMEYPGLSVLLVWMANLVFHGFHTVVMVNAVATVVTMLLAYRMLPKRMRGLTVLLSVGMPGLVGLSDGGLIQVMMLPFMFVVAWNWHRVGEGGRLGRDGVIRALAFGFAVSTQQLAWFFAPFLLVGMYLLRRGEGLSRRATVGVLLRYCAISGATFAAVNAPFFLTRPSAWFDGLLEPLTQHAIPLGNGMIAAVDALHLGSGDLSLYSNASLLLLITLITGFALFFRRLGPAVFVLPVVSLLFSARSLTAYFFPLLLFWGVTLICVDRDAFERAPRLLAGRFSERTRRAIVALTAVPSLVLFGLGFATPAPLQVTILNTKVLGLFQMLQQVTVQVTNTTGAPVSPSFLTSSTNLTDSTFWNASGGPKTLAPHQTAVYTLTATSQATMFADVGEFEVVAVADDPGSVSWSALHQNSPLSAFLQAPPDNGVYKPGSTVTFSVRVRSALTGSFVNQANVPVLLTQALWSGATGFPPTAVINGAPVGQNVVAETNADGVATFTVRCQEPQEIAYLFQASVQGYPSSESEAVPILWQ